MKLKKATWTVALAVGIGCWSVSEGRQAQGQSADSLVMVANKANTAAAGMSLGDAKKLLLGETSSWRGGANVIVVLTPAGSAERAAVLKRVCGMTETIYTRYEMQAAFTGQVAAKVREAASEAAVKDAVKGTPGAIGFVHKSQVDASVVTVLQLD